MLQAELLLDARARLGEGPWWSSGEEKLYWLDIDAHLLHRFDPLNESGETFDLGSKVGCTAPVAVSRPGEVRILSAGQSGIEEIVLPIEKGDGKIISRKLLVHPESGLVGNRYNDGKCSPEGRFWFGSLNMQKEPEKASLYRLEPDGIRYERILGNLTNSNGLGWSPDGSIFYHIDTPSLCVKAYDYDLENGKISAPRVVVRFSREPGFGRPDGMCVDHEGMIWVAHYAGARVTRWNPLEKKLVQTITVPALRVTSVTFGGEKLERLFITTARSGMDESESEQFPHAGGLFTFEPGVSGLPVGRFAS